MRAVPSAQLSPEKARVVVPSPCARAIELCTREETRLLFLGWVCNPPTRVLHTRDASPTTVRKVHTVACIDRFVSLQDSFFKISTRSQTGPHRQTLRSNSSETDTDGRIPTINILQQTEQGPAPRSHERCADERPLGLALARARMTDSQLTLGALCAHT